MAQNLSSAAVMIGTLRVNDYSNYVGVSINYLILLKPNAYSKSIDQLPSQEVNKILSLLSSLQIKVHN